MDFFLLMSCCCKMSKQASMRSQAIGQLFSSLCKYTHSVCSRSLVLSPFAMIPMNLSTMPREPSISTVNYRNLVMFYYQTQIKTQSSHHIIYGCAIFYITCLFEMLGMLPDMGGVVGQFKENIEGLSLLKDSLVVPHIANVLGNIDKIKKTSDVIHASNIVKQTQQEVKPSKIGSSEVGVAFEKGKKADSTCLVGKVSNQMEKLKWAGFSLTKEEIYLVEKHLVAVAEKNKAESIRFWGKILGTSQDYYVLQGRTTIGGGLEDTPKGAEKRGEGINYHTYWVNVTLLDDQWAELPLITPEHIKTARKIKRSFSGELFQPFVSYPVFGNEERYYLKAQLVRMTNSLEVVPKGIFKANDQNPKLVEYEDQPKIPEFAELSSLQTWTHLNLNVLNLGRCTHYIDPETPEDQLEALTSELAEKDPELERLRGISEDKLPEGNPLGIENVWVSKVLGDSQVFQKDEASSVYAVVVLKNILWPGWVTIGYKGGFCNYYTGYGHKWTQPAWNEYENGNLGEEAEDAEECPEPNPREEPKPVEEEPVEVPAEQD